MRVLVVGPRRGLCEALAREGIPHVVWSTSAKRVRSAERVHRAPIAIGEAKARREVEVLAAFGPFTHVIAGAESGVVTASVARRVLGARLSSRSTVLRCHDKLHMKQHLIERGIPMAPFLSPAKALAAEAIVDRLGLPVVVKPRAKSCGREIEIVHDPPTLSTKPLRGRLLEGWVDAPEISIESFVNGGRILFENITEYARKTHVNIVPAALDPATRAAVLALNRRVISALAWGFDAWQAFIDVEVDRTPTFPDAPHAHAAALVLHPGPGTVAVVQGLQEVRKLGEVVEARVKVRAGDLVAPRAGVADNVGHVVLCAPSREALLEAWKTVEAQLRIDLA